MKEKLTRRRFITNTAAGLALWALGPATFGARKGDKSMKAKEIADHFLTISKDWVNPNNTVDGIKVGDPEKEIHRIVVTWISSFDAIRAAVERKADMLITHEPTFYEHAQELKVQDNWEVSRAKKAFAEKNGLVILRNHDCWDRMPEIGIPWAWARFLALGNKPAAISGDRYQHRYDIEPVSLDDLAMRIARKTAKLGEPRVQVWGDGKRKVSRVGIGTGCGCRIDMYRELGCDVSIVCDDGTTYWGELQRAKDCDHPFIRVNHGTSEDPGMATLTKHINDNLPGLTAEHLPWKGAYRLVG